MSKLAQALEIAEARRDRARKKVLLLGLVTLLVLAGLLVVYLWLSNSVNTTHVAVSNDPPVSFPKRSAPVQDPVPPGSTSTAPPGLVKRIAEYQEALSGLEDHPRFGEDAKMLLPELKQLQEQVSEHDFSKLNSYYDETLSTAQTLVDDVEQFKRQLIDSIKRAYAQRDVKAFKASLEAYDAHGQDPGRVAKWREIADEADQIFPLLKAAEAHRVQNQPSEELSALQQLRKLGFTRENVPDRITEIKNTLKQASIDKRLQAAHSYYSNGRFVKAKSALQDVLKAEPSNSSAQQLLGDVESRLSQQKFNALYARAKASAADDRWTEAKQAYQQALSYQANHKMAMEGLRLASEITGLEDDILTLLSTPHRLGDEQVARYARGLLDKATDYNEASPKLTAVVKQLRRRLTQMSTPARVAIKSDGKARIEVRGVGYIEPTTYKVISLTPGVYELYSHCKGHVVGMSRIEIPVNQPSIEVSVGCGRKL